MIQTITEEAAAEPDLAQLAEIYERKVKRHEKEGRTAGERRYCTHDVSTSTSMSIMADRASSARTGTMDINAIIQNFITSMPGSQAVAQEKVFTTLADLLTPSSTLPLIETADESTVDRLLEFAPPQLVSLSKDVEEIMSSGSSTSAEAPSGIITLEQKKNILRRVLRSPQFSQNLSSLTVALRDGGLPTISEALNIPVKNGGYMRRGVPLGGGDAVEAFLEGVRDAVKGSEGQHDQQMQED